MSTMQAPDDKREPMASQQDAAAQRDESTSEEPRRPRSAVVALRLASEEVAALERAAEQASESTSEYVRKAIDLRQHGVTAPSTVNLSSGSFGVQVNRW